MLSRNGQLWQNRHGMHQTCANIPKRFEILDPQDPGSGILQDLGSCLSFSHGILEILDPVTTTFPWDPGELGSCTEKILLDPGDPGSSLSNLLYDLADFGSYTTIMPLYFEHPLHPMKFCFWFSISMRFLSLSTVNKFNHKQAHLVGSSTFILL